MKVLWLCNIVLPEIVEEFGFRTKDNMGGWIVGLWELLKKSGEYDLHICVPIINPQRMKDGRVNNINYYSFLRGDVTEADENQMERFCEIIEEVKPDILHIWGTEFPHAYTMLKAAEKLKYLDRTIVNLQGLIRCCADVLCHGLPEYVCCEGTSVYNLQREFSNRAYIENRSLKLSVNVVGRTEWDEKCVKEINPEVHYYHCGEILRPQFYGAEKWSAMSCRRHTVFLSQAGYPIKGFHYALETIELLKERYADLEIFVSGPDITDSTDDYCEYLKKEIENKRLGEVIHFVGMLDAQEMIAQYLSANVFLSPSLLENSSNSVCEAMMLGVPVVASRVGGMESIVDDENSGLLYSLNDTERCAELIGRIFDDDELAADLSNNELIRSELLNNRDTIMNTVSRIYRLAAGEK